LGYSSSERYRYTFISSLQDITDAVNSSADVNVADTKDGGMVVPMYDWATYPGEHFYNMLGMKTCHHFSAAVVVTVKEFSDSESSIFKLLKDDS